MKYEFTKLEADMIETAIENAQQCGFCEGRLKSIAESILDQVKKGNENNQ